MGSFYQRHKVLSVSLAVLLSFVGWEVAAPMRGTLAAHVDVVRSRYRLLTYGLPAPWLPGYARLLRQKYGIEVKAVAGCVVSWQLTSYVDSYDRVSMAGAIRKYGRDIFDECEREAEENEESGTTTKVTLD